MLLRVVLPDADHRQLIRLISGLAGLLIAALLLTGCGSGVRAIANGAAGSQSNPAATSTASIDGWANAGQITPTPQALAEAQAEAPTLTPPPEQPEPTATSQPETGTAGVAQATPAPSADYQPVSFAGTIESLPNTGDWTGVWQVSGRSVHVTSGTSIDQHNAPVAVGNLVAVEGWQRPDGGVDAGWVLVVKPSGTAPADSVTPGPANTPPAPDNSQPAPNSAQQNGGPAAPGNQAVPPRPIEFRGNVEQWPASGLVGTWHIAGRTVNVSAGTRIQQKQGALGTGALVQVMGWVQPNGTINAAMIQTKKVPPGQARGRAIAPGQNGKLNKGKGEGQNQGQQKDQGQNEDQGQQNNQGQDEDQGQTDNWNTEWQGTVRQLPANGYVGTWNVDGQQISVEPSCQIRTDQGTITNGTYVDIQGWFDANGGFHAARIQPVADAANNYGPAEAAPGRRVGPPPGRGNGNSNGNNNGNGKGKGNGNGHGN